MNEASSWDEHMDRHLGFPQSVVLADRPPVERVRWLRQSIESTGWTDETKRRQWARRVNDAVLGAGQPYHRLSVAASSS